MSISILVVTYNCSIEQSQTIQSLSSSNVCFNGVRLCIWNNGPKEISAPTDTLAALREKGFEVSIKQTPWNAPLSWIYNYFLENHPSNRYVILDHDSTLSNEYLQHLMKKDKIFLGMPIIRAKGAPLYPRANRRFSIGPYFEGDKVMSIGSGLLISQEAANLLKKNYGSVFDENFALYGVDTTFFKRLNKLGCTSKLQPIPGFEHSLSKLEDETEEVKYFRKAEESYNLGLMLRHYPSSRQLRSFIVQILKSPLKKNKVFIIKTIKAFAQGHHKRCRHSTKFNHSKTNWR